MKKERKKIILKDSDTVDKLITSGVSRATAYRAIKRGYYFVNYHSKQININKDEFDPDKAYDAAYFCLNKYFKDRKYNAGDMIQEAVIRIYELSGVSNDFNFMVTCAKMAMYSYLNKKENRRMMLSGDMESLSSINI